MEFTVMDWIWVFIGVTGVTLGPIMGYKSLKMVVLTKLDTKAHLRQQVDDLKQLVEHHKKEAQRWRGRMGQMTVKPTVEDGDPTNPDEFIPSLIKNYSHMAPDWLKPILKDDSMIKFLIDEAKKHPDAAKSMLANFIGKPKGKTPDTEPTPGQPSAADFSQFA